MNPLISINRDKITQTSARFAGLEVLPAVTTRGNMFHAVAPYSLAVH
jgi:hypothetical protein